MYKFLLFVCALVSFPGHFVWAADLQNTQCDIDKKYYREMPTVKKADEAAERKDISAEIKFYKIAVGENNPWAKFMLGLSYLNGQGVAQNVPEAVRLIKSAAEQDFGESQVTLGFMYDIGRGMPQNYAEAVRWYKSAALKGCADAWRMLSQMYVDGKGTPRDIVKAHMWINLYASRSDDKSAEENRDRLEKMMTPKQLNQAQQLATKCQAQNFKNCD